MTLALLASVACVSVMLWQDGENRCNDGDRYTSGKLQPAPFHRRFCGWPRRLLQAASLLSLVGLGALMGSWQGAVLLLTLPGAWFLATHLTCVDAPAMLLAFVSSLLWRDHPYAAVVVSCVSGLIHERGPVFAALYAWSPLLLVGMVTTWWWRRPAGRDADQLVGHGLVDQIAAHRPYVDLLDWRINVFGLRAVPALAAWQGAPVSAWAVLAVAWGSRVMGTDACRFLFWAAPGLLKHTHDVPIWVVVLHVVTFRRMI